MVQSASESGGKSWPKEISIASRPARDETLDTKNAASLAHTMRWGDGVLFDHEIVEEESLSLAGLAATYSPRA